jgi:hypothetical protein
MAYQIFFTVGPLVEAGTLTTGRYMGTTFVPDMEFAFGEEVVFRATFVDARTGAPVPGAIAEFYVSPPYEPVTVGPSDANGVVEFRYSPTTPAVSYAWLTNLTPPPGYVWEGGSVEVQFNVTTSAAVLKLLTGTYRTTSAGTFFEQGTIFKPGTPVYIRTTVVDGTGAPLPGAEVTFSLSGPLTGVFYSNPSDENGIAEALWETAAPNEWGPGTPAGSYQFLVTNVTDQWYGGYLWDGVAPKTRFRLK